MMDRTTNVSWTDILGALHQSVRKAVLTPRLATRLRFAGAFAMRLGPGSGDDSGAR